MSSNQADRLLSRINALHQSLHLDEGGHVTRMERDLMLNYLRDLYEVYADDAPLAPPPPGPPAQPSLTPAPVYDTDAPASVTAPPSGGSPPDPPDSYAQPVMPAPRPEPVMEKQVDPPFEPMPEVAKVSVPPPPPLTDRMATVQPPADTLPLSKTPPAAPPVKPTSTPTSTTTGEGGKDIDELLDAGAATGRFGRQPISDLTRALSINNRILFTKDLFGGDNQLLNTTLQQLNAFDSLAEAKPLLRSLVRRFDWLGEGKQETARDFILLVRRRYV